ncbi:MAG: asparaginase [Reyranellaceae bacterium]
MVISVLSLGGTISMQPASQGAGLVPQLSAESLVEGLTRTARAVKARSLMTVASSALAWPDVFRLAEEIRNEVASGAKGIVVTQGTDTIEEVAFAIDLLVQADVPIVFTGAMRSPSLPGSDAKANLSDAIEVASSPQARGFGTLVVMAEQIHAARSVQKVHTTSYLAFASVNGGPLGYVREGRTTLLYNPTRADLGTIRPTYSPALKPVALVKLGLDDDGFLLDGLSAKVASGLVVEGYGGGHVMPACVDKLERLRQEMPVIIAARPRGGSTLSKTYGFEGSEIDLLNRGFITSGLLDALKARVLLVVLLQGEKTKSEIRGAFHVYGGS